MTSATLDYLLRLAIAEKDKHAAALIGNGDTFGHGTAWGEASAAVRELLELSIGQAATASNIGRKGGAARVSKGPNANKTPEERAEWAAKMVAARRAKTTRQSASQPPPSKPSKPR
jgi:hypothetical protein